MLRYLMACYNDVDVVNIYVTAVRSVCSMCSVEALTQSVCSDKDQQYIKISR